MLIPSKARRACTLLGAALIVLYAGAQQARAADPGQPAETTGAFHAEAYAPLPDDARIEVRLMDDSPENLELGWRIQEELQRRGYAEGKGDERLVLMVETDVSIVTGPPSDGGRNAAGEAGSLEVVGFLRATLDRVETDERLWAAEAAYRRSDGDLPAGAKSLAGLLAEQIGRTIELDTVRIR